MARMLARVVLLFCALLPSVASGQYYDWGRSPQGMRWMQAKLPSGKVVFPDYYSDNAARVARYLDTIRPSISYEFRVRSAEDAGRAPSGEFRCQRHGDVGAQAHRARDDSRRPAFRQEPWLKHLVTHEYRHAVQYGNLYRRFMKGLGYVLGQQAGFVSSVLVPVWFLEGDAVMAENSDVVVRARASAVVYGRVPGLSDRGEAAVSARQVVLRVVQELYSRPLPVRLSAGGLVEGAIRRRHVVARGRLRGAASVYDPNDQMGSAPGLPGPR